MIEIEGILVSLEILEEAFVCDLTACKGACCYEGDYGAPITESEKDKIIADLEKIKPYLNPDCITEIEEFGTYEYDVDHELATALNKGKECVFAVLENKTWKCGIEKAWLDGKTDFQKPVSCHLYPIREVQLKESIGLNYHEWDICSPACKLGQKLKVPVYVFLKEPLERRFGKVWYAKLDEVAKDYLESNKN